MKKLFLSLVFGATFTFICDAQISDIQIRNEFNRGLNKEQFLNPESVSLIVTSQTVSDKNGVTHVYANQLVNGLEVFNANADMHFSRDGKLISYHHNFIPNIENRVGSNSAKISSNQALTAVMVSEGIAAGTIGNKAPQTENGKQFWLEPNLSSEKIYVKQGYFAIADQIKLIWQVEMLNDETNDWWNKKVDAKSGEILDQVSYTNHCNFGTPADSWTKLGQIENLWDNTQTPVSLGKKSNTGTYGVFPIPLESPARGPKVLMSNMASSASPLGWHDVDGVAGAEYKITRGNNVWAKEDTLNNNGSSGGYSPNGGDSLIFDYPFNVNAKPRTNMNAAITNLFYWNNIIHDIFSNYGFDENGGNFQVKNYSNQGQGNDAVMADALDGGGSSNANFASPVDGSSGRMQMYLWPTSGSAAANNTLYITSPSSIKGAYYGPQSVAGPRLTVSGLTGKVVLLKDSNASTNYGCGLIANLNDFAGKIVLIDRGGSCGTQGSATRTKIKAAQAAGAIAVIINYNINGLTPTPVSGSDAAITIPSITVGYGPGTFMKSALESGDVFVTLADSSEFNTARIYDGDFDNGIITHEYGHGISTRLTGGPSNSNCLKNAEQGGEGWSDFFALCLTSRVWENPATVSKGVGTFVIDQDTIGLGIRQYRYSRNMTINPLTYNNVKTNPEVHATGTIWCSVLYDLYLDMIDKYGFDADWYNGTGGNNKMLQLVIDGLKLQPCSPGFVDARNAIILADSINNAGANRDLLWKGFARRGLGVFANQGLSTSAYDQVADFTVPGASGIEQTELNTNFRIYPNPALTEITADVFGGASVIGIEIYDIEGKLVQQNAFAGNTLPSATVQLNQHPQGVYLVKIKSTNGDAVKKLLIN